MFYNSPHENWDVFDMFGICLGDICSFLFVVWVCYFFISDVFNFLLGNMSWGHVWEVHWEAVGTCMKGFGGNLGSLLEGLGGKQTVERQT